MPFFRNTNFGVFFDNSYNFFFQKQKNRTRAGFFAVFLINQEAYF